MVSTEHTNSIPTAGKGEETHLCLFVLTASPPDHPIQGLGSWSTFLLCLTIMNTPKVRLSQASVTLSGYLIRQVSVIRISLKAKFLQRALNSKSALVFNAVPQSWTVSLMLASERARLWIPAQFASFLPPEWEPLCPFRSPNSRH